MELFGYIAKTRQIRRHLFGYLARMLTLRNGVLMSKYYLPALNYLKAFEAAARHQSIKAASEELHVTPGAVSRQIKNLERRLRRRLFDRYHRRIALTVDGEMLLRAITTGFSYIQRAFVQLSSGRSANRLVISVDPDFAGMWLVPRLDEFYSFVPDTLVEILAERGRTSLQDGEVDCAIQYSDAHLMPDNGELLFRSRLFPVCARSSARLPPLRYLEDLRYHKLLHDRSTVEWQEYLHNCPRATDINVGSGVVFSETAHCMEAAVRGQGVAIGDDFLAALHLAEGRLVKLFDSAFYSRNAYYFILPDKETKHPAVTAFRNWLFQSIDRLRDAPCVRRLNHG